RTKEEKAMQRALLQYKNPKNYNIVYDALIKAGREDLIGNGPKCLIQTPETRYLASLRGKSQGSKKGYQGKNKKPKSGATEEKSSKKGYGKTKKSRHGDDRNGKNSKNEENVRMYKGKKSRGSVKERMKAKGKGKKRR
ncbi:DUF3362 domain-containing protein, partial [Clostridium chrysemydis]